MIKPSFPLALAAREAVREARGIQDKAVVILAYRIAGDANLIEHAAAIGIEIVIAAEIEKYGPVRGSA